MQPLNLLIPKVFEPFHSSKKHELPKTRLLLIQSANIYKQCWPPSSILNERSISKGNQEDGNNSSLVNVRSEFKFKNSNSKLVSRGLVKEQFAWRHYYFFLNAEGIAYLREQLGLPEDVFPATHRVKVEQSKSGIPEKAGHGYGRSESDRAGYRQTDRWLRLDQLPSL
uniref:Plectin/S10 N-terminal domain-containing protein n=1 Tax=Ditylenchus dipsaci TaxID=166011 RepID=A0A915ET06_9BILA